jgi:hypothetical protein
MDDDLHNLFGDAPARARDEEAAARLAIERALAALRDPAARLRVLQWAIERFGAHSAHAPGDHTPTRPDAPGPIRPHDPAVSVDDLADLFDAGEEPGERPTRPRKSG